MNVWHYLFWRFSSKSTNFFTLLPVLLACKKKQKTLRPLFRFFTRDINRVVLTGWSCWVIGGPGILYWITRLSVRGITTFVKCLQRLDISRTIRRSKTFHDTIKITEKVIKSAVSFDNTRQYSNCQGMSSLSSHDNYFQIRKRSFNIYVFEIFFFNC